MQQRDALLDGGLRRRGTARGEIHFAELVRKRGEIQICAKRRKGKSQNKDKQSKH
jgi:hypothetical protein